jgi:hypothetical protein
VLIPNSTRSLRSAMQDAFTEDEWDSFGLDGHHLCSCLEMGDNFSVITEEGNEEEVAYYVLMCTKIPFIVQSAFDDAWGSLFQPGDIVVAGKYYQKWVGHDSNYVLLLKSQTAYHHAHHIMAVKFPMLPLDHSVFGSDMVYKLTDHCQLGIEMAMDLFELDV